MRPIPGDDAWIARPRPADHADPSLLTTAAGAHGSSRMSFVIADEASVDAYLEQPTVPLRFRDPRKADRDDRDAAARRSDRDTAPPQSPSFRTSNVFRSPATPTSQGQMSRPMTPIMLGTSCTGSVLSSRRNSLAGSFSDHASISDEEPMMDSMASDMMDSGSAPQLVMPSIQMPSRRPFTEAGKNLGRLKVMLAGDSGVGKTSLLRAIVQTCEHIVHIDSTLPQAGPSIGPTSRSELLSPSTRDSRPANEIVEVYASTKAYPEWWSELDVSRTSSRRKSLGDSVLERNVCFCDTPGFSSGSSAMETIAPCVDYVESHMNSVALGAVSDTDMLSLLGGDGGCQVDVVLYLVSQRMKPIDLEFLSRLAPLTNVIPILAQADKLSLDQVAACKAEVAGQLRRAKIRPFSFAPGPDSAATVPTVPYAISCANASDHEIMDASLLMSPDYVQPLIESELAFLVQNVFSPDGASWLRHAAARKYLEWRQASPPRQRQLCSPADSPGRRSRPTLGRPPQPGLESPSLALIRMSEPHRHDGSPPRLHVADWAADLQRSLATEQTQYEALARGERAVWLTERLSECVADGTLVAVGGQKNTPGGRRTGRRVGTKTKAHQDPLGLLQVTADLKAKGWVAIELLGSLSVIGGLAFWLSRRHWQMEPVQMADEWARFWGMDI